MTTISKLSLQGIRSYSDAEPETIEFFKPLTIIVGSNGSGKTTIIEALKYICTGSQPPLSDGGKSFVHDPRINGQSIVRAQIRLAFRTANEEKAVLAVRTFQLTQKKSKREFKAMESVVRIKDLNTGIESSISQRCADMDKLVPQLMGVSPAVLENVIFTHQDESFWPLGDSKSLKLKFDDIFAATRYTKALESIAKLRKEKSTELKELEADLRVIQTNLEHAHRLEDDFQALKANINSEKQKSTAINTELQAVEARLAVLAGKSTEIKAQKQRIDTLEAQIPLLEAERQRASDRMLNEYDDDDSVLRAEYAKFQAKIVENTNTLNKKKAELIQLNLSIKSNQSEYEELVKLQGKLEAQAAEYKRKLVESNTLALKLIEKYSLPINNATPTTPVNTSELLSLLNRILLDRENSFRTYRSKYQSTDNSFETSLNNLKSKLTQLIEQKSAKSTIAKSNIIKVNQLMDRIKSLDQSMGEYSNINNLIESAEKELTEFNSNQFNQFETLKSNINNTNIKLKSNTTVMQLLLSERKQFDNQTELLNQLKFKQKQLKLLKLNQNELIQSIQRQLIQSKYSNQIQIQLPKEILNQSNNPDYIGSNSNSNIDRIFESRLAVIRDRLQSATVTATGTEKQLNQLSGELTLINSNIHSIELELESIRKEFITANLIELLDNPNTDMTAELNTLSAAIEKQSNEKILGGSISFLYKKYLELASTTHSCPFCIRPFNSTAEESEFIKQTEDKINKLGSDSMQEQQKKRLKDIKDKYNIYKQLDLSFANYQRLKIELNQLKSKYNQLKQSQSELIIQQKDQQLIVTELTIVSTEINSLIQLSNNYSRLELELSELFHSIQFDQQKLNSQSSNGRTLEIVNNEYTAAESDNIQLNNNLTLYNDSLRQLIDNRELIQNRLNQLKSKSIELSTLQSDRSRLESEENDTRQSHTVLKSEIERITGLISPIETQIQQLELDREQQRLKQNESELTLRRDIEDLQRDIHSFKMLLEEQEKYKPTVNTAESKEQLESRRHRIELIHSDRDNCSLEISRLDKLIVENASEDSDIKANLDYRDRDREVKSHQSRLQQEKHRYIELTGNNNQLQSGNIISDEKRYSDLKDRKSQLSGMLLAMEKQATSLLTELSTNRYLNIDQQYRDKLIEFKTLQMANTDLETYYRALDRALMHFHSIKMKEINEILRDYWRSVYRGKDIDEIYIQSSQETENKRRSYNYSVMMRSGDTELEMRGRCSAGQRVLASLLIRLALADTFCLSCGVLALDEPTTNLDHLNITAFAAALNEILSKRRQQSNFQLIIITHDEQFVEEIGKRAHAEYYYRVFKDNQNNSKIRRQAILETEAEE